MMKDLLLVVAAGLFSLGGVFLGALLTPLTQLYLERKRENRAAERGKLLIAGELLHAQLIFRAAAKNTHWPHVEDVNAYFPTSAWQENRSSIVGKVPEDLWEQLVMAYALLEQDRTRLVLFSRPELVAIPAKELEGLEETAINLGRLRKRLGGGGTWLEDIQSELKPRMVRLNNDFKRWLDGLNDDELKEAAVSAQVKQRAKTLGEMNEELGDKGAWFAEISEEIERRLK